jgi:hypothetical protein
VTASFSGARALFGAPLNGDAPVYLVYVDEAGTSAKEPVTVVVGVIIHADRSWRLAADQVSRTLDTFVPPDLRPGFIFHAETVWGGYIDYRDRWSREDRIAFIAAMAAIPRQLHLAISIGKVRRDWNPGLTIPMPLYNFHRMVAFHRCAARANKHIGNWGERNEVAAMVAEDAPTMRHFLKHIVAVDVPDALYPLNQEYVALTRAERATGSISQTRAGAIDRIIDTVHFAQKGEAPLLQIADACAFAFRRYFAQQEHGDLWVKAMLGKSLIWEDWQGPTSDFVFSFNPDHRLKLSVSFQL